MTAQLLTVEDLRRHITTSLDDDALQLLLNASEDALNEWAGVLTIGDYEEPDPVAETVYAWRQGSLELRRPALSVVSIADITGGTSTVDLIDGTDWRLEGGTLYRMPDGRAWGQRTVVTYVPVNTADRRRVGVIKLVQLEINFQPGMGSEGGAGWQESYARYLATRQEILESVFMPPLFA